MGEYDPLVIGGSSAASALGVSRRESRLALYERLRGGGAAKTWTENQQHMLACGKHVEPLLIQLTRKRFGVDVQPWPDGADLQLGDEPRIKGSPDALVADGIGAELKMVGRHGDDWGDEDSDQMPADYLCQCLHYLMVTGLREWWLLALHVPSYRLARYIVRRNDETERLMRRLEQSERSLLRMVDAGTPPDPLDEEEARRLWFATEPGKVEVASGEVMVALARRYVASRVRSIADGIISECNATILSHMKDAEALQHAGEVVATAKPNREVDPYALQALLTPQQVAECMVFDTAKAKALAPAAYQQAMTAKGARPILFTKAFKKSTDRLLQEHAVSVPFLPEFEAIRPQVEEVAS